MKKEGKTIYQDKPAEAIRVTGICGSLKRGGATSMALSKSLEGSSELGVSTSLMELGDYNMVFYGSMDPADYPRDIFQLRREIEESQGIILASPEYYGSISGVLKNMLDLLGERELEGKIIGIIGVAGGYTGAINSLNTMRLIGRNMHSWVLPQEVSISNSSEAFTDSGDMRDSELEKRLLDLGRQVAKFSLLQQKIRKYDFMKNWESLPTW